MRAGCVIGLLLTVLGAAQAQDSLGISRVATLEFWQGVGNIQMVGNLAYITGGTSGLHIMDLTDAAHPVEIGTAHWYDWPGISSFCFVTGNRAYVSGGSGCRAFDISDPQHPVELARWWEGRERGQILVHGDYAVIHAEEHNYVVADISDLNNVHQIGDFFGMGANWPVGMLGDYLCMAGFSGGVLLFDMSNPAQPQRVSAADTTFLGISAIAGNYIYLAARDSGGLRIINASDPLNPVEVAACDSGRCGYVTVTGNHAIVTKSWSDSLNGLDIWNISDPANPVFEGQLAGAYEFSASASSGNRLCACNNSRLAAMTVVDLTNPAAPFVASTFGHNSQLNSLTVNGTTGYLLGGWRYREGVQTLDLTDPSRLLVNGGCDLGGSDLALHGHHAYLANFNGVCVLDVTNPAHPESLWCPQPPDYFVNPSKIRIAGNYAYGIYPGDGGPGELYTISLQDSVIPELVDTLIIPNAQVGFGLQISNGNLYLAAGIYGFYVYDLANPGQSQLVGTCDLPNMLGAYASDLAVFGQYVYVADNLGGVRIIAVDEPAHPAEVSSVVGYATTVEITGNTLFINGGTEIQEMDITDPVHPEEIGYYSTLECISDMDVVGSYLLTVSESELRAYQCDALADAHPRANPPPRVCFASLLSESFQSQHGYPLLSSEDGTRQAHSLRCNWQASEGAKRWCGECW